MDKEESEKSVNEKNLLFNLIENKQHEELKKMLLNGSDVNTVDTDNYTLLHMAVDYGDIRSTQILLETKGCKTNVQTTVHKLAPLHFAAQDGKTQLVRMLLDHGAYINIINHTSCTPLYFAVCGKHFDTVKLLLSKKADVNIGDSNKISPLLQAVSINVPLTQILLNHGAEMSSFCRELHTALLANKPDVAMFILDNLKTDLSPNRIGRSPLQNAAAHISGDPDEAAKLMKKLIELGDDVNYMNNYGTVLHVLIGRTSYLIDENYIDLVAQKCFDCVVSLEQCDLDKYLSTNGSGTPLNFAIKLNQYYFAEKLIIEGAKVDKCNLDLFKYTKKADKTLKLLYYSGFFFDETFKQKCRPKSDEDLHYFKSICQWIDEKQTEVMSLKCLTRISLRRIYGRKINLIITKISYPQSLVRFLTLNDVE